jgi:hypothetical protein
VNERDLADQFIQDVDRLLADSGRADSAPLPADYAQTVNLARKLIAVDFSVESQVRHSLRRKLLAQVGKAQGRAEDRPAHNLKSFWPWLLLRAQAKVVHRDIWAASALIMMLGTAVTLALHAPTSADTALPFVLVAPVVAAMGVAFVYGPAVDPTLEIELATPVSPRLVLLARLALVFGFDLGLGLAGSAILSLLRAEISFWPLVSAWLAPMAFLSALAFLLTISSLEPGVGMLVSLGLWIVQSVARFSPANNLPLPDLTADAARPWLWLLAFLLGGLGFWLAGGEERWLGKQA